MVCLLVVAFWGFFVFFLLFLNFEEYPLPLPKSIQPDFNGYCQNTLVLGFSLFILSELCDRRDKRGSVLSNGPKKKICVEDSRKS